MRKFTANYSTLADWVRDTQNTVLLIFGFTNPDVTDIDQYYDEYGETDWSAVLEVVYDYKAHKIVESQVVYVDPDNVSDDDAPITLDSSELAAVNSAFGATYGYSLDNLIGMDMGEPLFVGEYLQ